MKKFKNLEWDNRKDGDTALRQMQLVELRMLRIVDDICKRHHIQYWMSGGTALGAVRHGGFIPWDDDVDIEMPLDELRRFLIVANEELPEDISIEERFRNGISHHPMIKLRDGYSSAYSNRKILTSGKHVGISLDIFPMMRYAKVNLLMSTSRWLLRFFLNKYRHPRLRVFKPLTQLGMYVADFLFRISNRGRKIAWGYSPYMQGPGCDSHFSFEIIMPPKVLFFEGYEFFSPFDVDAYLRELYGDYLKLPPKEQRVAHESIILPFIKCNHPRAMDWPKS